jgi:hypothetical protein
MLEYNGTDKKKSVRKRLKKKKNNVDLLHAVLRRVAKEFCRPGGSFTPLREGRERSPLAEPRGWVHLSFPRRFQPALLKATSALDTSGGDLFPENRILSQQPFSHALK